MSRKSKALTITPATPTTPAMSSQGATEKERMHLSPAEFGQQLSLLARDAKDLVKMARKVGHLKPGQSLKLSNGETMGVKELNALVTRHGKTLKQLKKNYTARGSRKKRSAVTKSGALRKAGEGFTKGSFLTPELLAFVQNANFAGVSGPKGGTPIREVLAPLLEAGLLSRSILTVLLTIYEFANGLRTEVNGKKYFRAGPEMERYLAPYLSALENADRAKSDAQMTDAKGNLKPRFSRNQFVYNRLQSIANQGLIPTDDLDAERKNYIENQQVKDLLKQVQDVLSGALAAWNPKSK